ncbi:MAG: hypothetical protein NTV93_10775 [Verrucomicrobia bacterium]|nr:hypothetical protein [Verrucomicrobiota bacterium]
MTSLKKALIFSMVLGSALAQNEDPWALPRDLAQFQFLLDRSPFSLPTAEESSPLADRYTLTGVASIDGEAMVFVLDKTTQERHMVSKTPNNFDMGLVEYLPDPDPRHMRATIKINGQTATISYSDPVAQPGQPGVSQTPGMAMPQGQNPTAVVNAPPGQTIVAGAPPNMQQGNPQAPPRRVIRRRIISGQPAPGP